jgi:hypothetical protein
MNSVVNNQEHFLANLAVNSVNTRSRDHPHRPTANISYFKKMDTTVPSKSFNSLASNLTSLMDKKAQFKVSLERYLNTHSFYSVEKFLTFKNASYYTYLHTYIHKHACTHTHIHTHIHTYIHTYTHTYTHT